ncbi:MAG TPA: hypothetical protein VMS75_05535 [Terriglobales bacterium]|nr:hypothetical protein [Terriglobales bacterium]
MRAAAAVGVDDDLAAGQAGVADRAADLEPAGRVDEVLDALRAELGRDDLLDDLGDDAVAAVDAEGDVGGLPSEIGEDRAGLVAAGDFKRGGETPMRAASAALRASGCR